MTSAQKTAFLVGNRIYLRPLCDADVRGHYPSWLNDAEVCQGNSHHTYPYTQEQALAYIHQTVQDPQQLILAIVTNADDRHIGNVALQRIHPIARCAEFAILIGD